MSTTANTLSISGRMNWKQEQTNNAGAFAKTTQGDDSLSFAAAASVLDAAVYTEVLLDEFTLAAAASQTINFNAFTTKLNVAVTATKLKGVVIKATATVTGGKLRIAPGAANGLDWPLAGTTPTITLDVGTDVAGLVLLNGISVTLSAADAAWDLSNPGSAQITVRYGALVGA